MPSTRPFALLLPLLLSFTLAAQEPEAPEADSEGLQSTQSPVAVEAPTSDARLQRRLDRILDSIDVFGQVSLAVREGVVTLTGRVEKETQKEWVGALAAKTEGTTAVLNRIEVLEPPIWNWQPAWDELRQLWREFVAATPRLGAGLLFLALFTLVAWRLASWIARPFERRVDSELLRSVVRKSVLLVMWLVGFYVFLRVSGLTQIALTVVGGTGVLGVVLGFAFRDIAENFLASVLISMQKPFRYGDVIQVDDKLGVVQRVTPRGTILMDFDGNYIQIANAHVYKSTIKNFTANPNVRGNFAVGIGYDAALADTQRIVLDTVQAHEAVLADPKPQVLVDDLGSSSVQLTTWFWVDGSTHSLQKVRSAVMRRVLHALQQAGVSMPDDAREIVFPDGVPLVREASGVDGEVPRPSTRRAAPGTPAPQATEAEADLLPEEHAIAEQARNSRPPEEGKDILADDKAALAQPVST